MTYTKTNVQNSEQEKSKYKSSWVHWKGEMAIRNESHNKL